MKLPIITLQRLSFERFQEVSDIVLDQQGAAQDAHDFNDRLTQFEVMFNNSDKTVYNDGNMYLDTYSILGFSPKGFDSEMLLDPLEEKLNLPSVFVKKGNVLGLKIDIVRVICEISVKVWRIVHDSSDRNWVMPFVSLSGESNHLISEDIIFPLKQVFPFCDFIVGTKFLSDDKEGTELLNRKESGKVKVPPVEYIARKRNVCKPVHCIDIMHFCCSDSIEYRNLCDDINLCVDFDTRLGTSEFRPPENGHAQIDRCGINRIESSMQLKLSCDTSGLSDRDHVKCKLLKDSIVPDRVGFGQYLSIDWCLTKAQKKRFITMCNSYICKFPKTSATNKLTEHQNQQMIPMRQRPALGAVVVLDYQSSELPLGQKLCDLSENVLANMHTCSKFDTDAKVCLSKVGHILEFLYNCA